MKVQMTGSYPCIAGTLNTSTVAKALAPGPPVTLAHITLADIARMPKISPLTLPTTQPSLDLSPLLRARKVHVFSPAVASQSPSKEKLLDGFRALSDLITPHCGRSVSIGASAIWLGVDTASAIRTVRDPKSSPGERLSAAGGVTADTLSLFGGILGAAGLDQAATAINFAVVAGDHVQTGQLQFTPGELAQFSSDPQADDTSNILKLTEVFLPSGPQA